MKPAHDEIVKWMNAYFAEYNASAQNAETVHRMDAYFAPSGNEYWKQHSRKYQNQLPQCAPMPYGVSPTILKC
jgi:hypothetical protein